MAMGAVNKLRLASIQNGKSEMSLDGINIEIFRVRRDKIDKSRN